MELNPANHRKMPHFFPIEYSLYCCKEEGGFVVDISSIKRFIALPGSTKIAVLNNRNKVVVADMWRRETILKIPDECWDVCSMTNSRLVFLKGTEIVIRGLEEIEISIRERETQAHATLEFKAQRAINFLCAYDSDYLVGFSFCNRIYVWRIDGFKSAELVAEYLSPINWLG